ADTSGFLRVYEGMGFVYDRDEVFIFSGSIPWTDANIRKRFEVLSPVAYPFKKAFSMFSAESANISRSAERGQTSPIEADYARFLVADLLRLVRHRRGTGRNRGLPLSAAHPKNETNMNPNPKIPLTHPGLILRDEFFAP